MASHGVPRATDTEPQSEQSRLKQLRKIEEYQELVELVRSKIEAEEYTPEVLGLTSKLLTRNPEYYTIWSNRRLILQQLFHTASNPPTPSDNTDKHDETVLNLIITDLHFLIPLLRQFPKCYWIWNHRLWLLQQSTQLLPRNTARRLWQEELGLVGKMLSLDSRNFHGWGYRRTVVAQLESPALAPSASERIDGDEDAAQQSKAVATSMVEEEFAYTTKMIGINLSNFSAWHSRSKLIPRLLEERGATDAERRSFVGEELEMIWQALWTDPYDQSLWFYHDYLMVCISSHSPTMKLSSYEQLQYLETEMEKTRELLEDAKDCKWIYQSLLAYVSRYQELEGGNKHVTTLEMRGWLEELKKLDPLRIGRWRDLGRRLGLGDD